MPDCLGKKKIPEDLYFQDMTLLPGAQREKRGVLTDVNENETRQGRRNNFPNGGQNKLRIKNNSRHVAVHSLPRALVPNLDYNLVQPTLSFWWIKDALEKWYEKCKQYGNWPRRMRAVVPNSGFPRFPKELYDARSGAGFLIVALCQINRRTCNLARESGLVLC